VLTPKTHSSLSPAEYERLRSGYLQTRRLELVAAALERLSRRPTRVLEIGFGSGRLLYDLANRFPHVDFLGLEVDGRMLAHACSRYARPNLTYAAVDEHPLPAAEFQLLFSIDVLHHIRPLEPFLDRMARCLAADGLWLVIEPNVLHPYVWLKQERMRRSGVAGEDHFWPRRAERAFHAARLRIEGKSHAFLFPGWLPSLPKPLGALERLLEGVPVLAGAVVYRLAPMPRAPCACA
jgi:SAM-dependent methyltransferase